MTKRSILSEFRLRPQLGEPMLVFEVVEYNVMSQETVVMPTGKEKLKKNRENKTKIFQQRTANRTKLRFIQFLRRRV